ncbi:MAG: orotate phosphoribosyltransferase [Rhodothermales bacterium]
MVNQVRSIEEQIASSLLSIGAVSLNPKNPYTWASGLRSPIYCDNRMIMGYPDVRASVTAGFVSAMEKSALDCDVLAGTATAGIPHAAWLAHATRLPMVYVRSTAKAHGRKNQIEGPVKAGQSTIVIEDLISTGKSSIAAVHALQAEGVHVHAVLAIFSYGFDEATTVFDTAGVPFYTLTTFQTLLKVAEAEGQLAAHELETMQKWRESPRAWSEAFKE